MSRTSWRTVGLALIVALALTSVAYAQESEEKTKNWTNKTDLGFASTSGNSTAKSVLRRARSQGLNSGHYVTIEAILRSLRHERPFLQGIRENCRGTRCGRQ